MYLRQSTSQVVRFGQFVDSTDGATAETALTIAQADMQLSKDGGAFAQKNATGNATHDADGWYSTTLNTTDTNTVGELILQVNVAGALYVTRTWYVIEEVVYDDLFGAASAGIPTVAEIQSGLATAAALTTVDNEIAVIDANVDAILVDTGTTLPATLATAQADLDTITDTDGVILGAAGVDLIWDETLTGGTHNVVNSAGRRIRQLDAAFEVHSGTAQAGTSTTITLDTGASATDDIYNGDRIVITAGTGAQEHGLISDYNGTTKVATLSKAWVVTPDATSEFVISPADCDVETWNNVTVTGDGDWAELQTDVDAILIDTGITLQGELDGIQADTEDLQTQVGAAGAGLTAVPWNAAWDAEVQSEVNDALVALGLDHLVGAAVTGTDVVDNSIIAQLVSSSATADWDTYVNTTESLQALRDRGDAAWTTGAGGSPPQLLQETTIATLASQTSFTLTAGSADNDAYNGAIIVIEDQSTAVQKAVGTISDYVGASKTVTLSSDPAIFTIATGDTVKIIAALGSAGSAPTAAAIADAVWDEAQADHVAAGSMGVLASEIATIDTVVDGIQTDLDNGTDGLGAIKTAVDAIPTSNPTAAAIADQVWDEAAIAHVAVGSMGREVALGSYIVVDTTIAGTPTSTTIEVATGGSAVDDFYNDATLLITSGTGVAQARIITDYNGTTKVCTLDEALATTPVNGDGVAIVLGHSHAVSQIADAIWNEAQADHTTAGTFGEIATEIASILADTNELQTDNIPGTLTTIEGKIDTIDTNVDAILVDTGTTLPAQITSDTDAIDTAIAALNDLSAAQVNAEVVDVIRTDTLAELGAVPAAASTLADKINWLFMLARNQLEQTSTTATLRADNGATAVATAAVSDNATTAQRNEWA